MGHAGKGTKLRRVVIVLGDQLDATSAAFDGFDQAQDAVLMMEVREEASYIPQHKRRLAFFFAAMRHFRDAQREAGRRVHYSELDDPNNRGSLAAEIVRWTAITRPDSLVALEPGDFRVRRLLEDAARSLSVPLDVRRDRHFLCAADQFQDFLRTHSPLLLENFYRFMRMNLRILIDDRGEPVGGKWNYDHQNRARMGRGAPAIPSPRRFPPDATTREVLALVEREFPDSPGRLDDFGLPVSREQALAALDDFVGHRLINFGRYQDAMRTGEPVLFHSMLSGPLNLHLLNPREVIDRALNALDSAPLPAVEGFVRQIIGWREFVRGIYVHLMPDYAARNALAADLPAPRFLWTGATDMRCVAEAVGHTVEHAYAHHIERLMVLGQLCLLLGVRPYDVHRWHMSMFWDAIDWVSLPNVLGMSQHADGGLIGTKPYCASGNYIARMSDYCRRCRYDPRKASGDDACPFTTLYWDFLARHRARFQHNQRMRYSYMNLARKDRGELSAIRRRAEHLQRQFTRETFL
ncbi:MAG: cryptochrome/photolyase family protein [Acetobacteraceae bacterium]|nr:cryptochrome/photolyase family protein [Acetobacteraceae bacterium]